MKFANAAVLLLVTTAMSAQIRVVERRSDSPLVTFRLVFLTGAASDPAGKLGAASLTAAMLAQGGTRDATYKQILDAMFPMATSVASQVDKEMTVFSASTHADNLEPFYTLFRAMLLEPGWREEDFTRLRDDAINFLQVSLRGNNDEELGKEVLYNQIYAGHPYGWHNTGAVSALRMMTVADLQGFYRANYTQANLVLGIAGGYSPEFLARLRKDFAALPKGKAGDLKVPEPKAARGISVTMVEKDTRAVACSMGFPIEVKRGHPDYPALLVAQSYLGQHRMSGGRLYERIRQVRGLNYGDYAYIEYFPRGMFQFEPAPNLGRQSQIFQIWIRPVEPPTAHFTLRLALYEFDRLLKQGLSREDFERSRSFLSKYTNLLMKTKRAELGYAIDSQFYGIPEYASYIKTSLAKLTVDDVNRAIRKHLSMDGLRIVVIAKNCEELKKKILANDSSPMTYNAPKPPEVLEEDGIIESWKLDLRPDSVKIVPVDQIFEQKNR